MSSSETALLMNDVETTNLDYALMIIPCITGSISFICSLSMLWAIYHGKKMKRVKERILVGLGVLNIIFSMACMMSTFLAPSDISPHTGFILLGNSATCDFQGWMYQAGCAAPMYNSSLSLFYLLVIRFKKNENEMNKYFLPLCHSIVIGWAVISATTGLFLKIYNYGGIMGCWIDDDHAPLCEAGYELSSCKRGRVSEVYVWLFGALPLLVSLLVTSVTTTMLYLTVRNQEAKSNQYKAHYDTDSRISRLSHSSIDGDIILGDSEKGFRRIRDHIMKTWEFKRRNFKISKKVLESGILYIMAFWVTYLFFSVIAAYAAMGMKAPDWVRVVNVILLPSQGSFNYLIYKIPNWQYRWRIRKSLMQRQKRPRSNIKSTQGDGSKCHVETQSNVPMQVNEQHNFAMKESTPIMTNSDLNKISLVERNHDISNDTLDDKVESPLREVMT